MSGLEVLTERKVAEAADIWREIDSERVLRVLMQNLDGMVFRCAIDEVWTLHFASDGCAALTGYTQDELKHSRGMSLETMTHPEDRQRVRRTIMAAVKRGAAYRVDYRIRCRDGREKWVLERGRAVVDESGREVLEGFIEDVTERLLTEVRLAETELRYRSIFENSVIGMFQTSPDGHYLAANQALAELYGYSSPAELVAGLSDIATRLYVLPGRRDDFTCQIQLHGKVRDFESEVYRRDGKTIWISENAHAVRASDGTVLYYEGTVEDISERRQYQAQLEYQATHDPLTGLPNRNLLQDRLEQAIASARRSGSDVAVAFVDIDNFKFINDSLGHAVGDRLLVEIGDRLKACMRGTDTVARYGGDEFVLILGELTGLGSVVQMLERILSTIHEPVLLDGHDLRVAGSIGVSLFPLNGADLEILLSQADAAMYHAKQSGKGCFRFYAKELNAAAHERLVLESALRRAVAEGDLTVAYQPKVDATGRMMGCEALVRWESREFGPVSPVKFIPLAEETGLIRPITDFVLRTACREAAGWGGLHVAVNLSARQFSDRDLVGRISDILVETGLPASCLQLEITEGFLVGDVEKAVAILTALKELGVSIAVDDFGTGYSSLAYLKRFPLDILKIDRSFVMECHRGAEAMAIPKAIISLGHSLGLRIVAEGVENADQLEALALQRCEEFQGYYFSRPVPAAAIRDALRAEGGGA
ncbi:MAG: putative bifunctional diguanylate cyclase/phosphodiesterase [Actinomycetota bacterium]